AHSKALASLPSPPAGLWGCRLALLQHIPDLLDLMELLWQQAEEEEEEEEGEQQQGSGLQAVQQQGPGGVGAAAAAGVVYAGPAAAAAPLLAQCLADTLLQLAWDCVSGSSSDGGGSGGGGRVEQPGRGGVEVLAQAAQAKSSVSGRASGGAGWLGCAGSGLDEGLGGEALAGLTRLQGLCPGVLGGRLPHLALLLLATTGQEQQTTLSLVHAALLQLHSLPHTPTSSLAAKAANRQGQPAQPTAQMLLLGPLLRTALFSPSPDLRRWALGLVHQLHVSPVPPVLHVLPVLHAPSAYLVGCTWAGELSLLQPSARLLVLSHTPPPLPPLAPSLHPTPPTPTLTPSLPSLLSWLHSLTAALISQRLHTPSASSPSSAFALAPADLAAAAAVADAQPSPALTATLTALLAHPLPHVQLAAAGAVRQLLLLRPQAALTFLPTVLWA
ncbi:hypothetical protein QJQ45_024743, partial [Haematococcus lacustris]